MHGWRRIGRAAAGWIAGTVLALGGCGGPSSGPGPGRAPNPFDANAERQDILLTVQNDDFRDATVHVLWNGLRTRAGMVVGKTSQTFRMRWRSEEIQLYVDFVGQGEYWSERVGVLQGDHLHFVIPAR
jgi:hypothetical protein